MRTFNKPEYRIAVLKADEHDTYTQIKCNDCDKFVVIALDEDEKGVIMKRGEFSTKTSIKAIAELIRTLISDDIEEVQKVLDEECNKIKEKF